LGDDVKTSISSASVIVQAGGIFVKSSRRYASRDSAQLGNLQNPNVEIFL